MRAAGCGVDGLLDEVVEPNWFLSGWWASPRASSTSSSTRSVSSSSSVVASWRSCCCSSRGRVSWSRTRSRFARAAATGVLSSCEASATSCLCAVTDRVRASSIVLKARASRPSSSERLASVRSGGCRAGDAFGVVVRRRTGRRVVRATARPSAAAAATATSETKRNRSRCARGRGRLRSADERSAPRWCCRAWRCRCGGGFRRRWRRGRTPVVRRLRPPRLRQLGGGYVLPPGA